MHTSTLAFVANTDTGAQVVHTLASSDPTFQANDEVLAANRTVDCQQLHSKGIANDAQGISTRAKASMCNVDMAMRRFATPYTMARNMILAHDMHEASKDKQSSVPQDFDWDDPQGGNPHAVNMVDIDTFNTIDVVQDTMNRTGQLHQGLSRRDSKPTVESFFNPSSGAIGKDVCVEAEFVALCARGQVNLPKPNI